MSSFKNAILHLLESLKFFEKNKVLVCGFSKYKKLESILKLFNKYGVINDFFLKDGRLFVDVNLQGVFFVKYFPKAKYVSSYKIQSAITRCPENVYILSTHLGIMDSANVVSNNLGGQLLFILKMKTNVIKKI
jgi:ribosomal protein S8